MFDKVRDIILEYVDMPKDDIKPETQFLADMAMNSLDIMTMVGQMEDEFDVTIETDDLNDIFTVQDLVDYLNDRV